MEEYFICMDKTICYKSNINQSSNILEDTQS